MHMLNLPWIVGVPPGGPDCDVPAALELCQKAQENGQRVIAASVAVEKELEKVINARIAGTPGQVNTFFADHVLSADWFTFSAKRKLVFIIFAEFEHLTWQDKLDLEKVLARVISFRNRFAHGHFVVRQSGGGWTVNSRTGREPLLYCSPRALLHRAQFAPVNRRVVGRTLGHGRKLDS